MLTFAGAQLVFTILFAISSILVVIVLGSYHRQGQNTLLRAACVILLLMTLTLFFGNFYWNTELQQLNTLRAALDNEDSDPQVTFRDWVFPEKVGQVALFQAIALNYLQITLHALLSSAIVNSTCQALGWRIFGRGDTSGLRSRVFLCITCFTPLFPCIYLIMKRDIVIYPLFFYYCVYDPQFFTRIAWIGFFSLPGVISGGYLFVRSLIIRHRTLKLSNTSQLSFFYMLRLGLALVMFAILTILGCLPLKVKFISAFIPTTYGIMVFLMYGFGAPARKVYAELFGVCADDSTQAYPSISRSTFKRSSNEESYERRASPIPVPEFPGSPFYISDSPSNIPRRGSAPIVDVPTIGPGGLGKIREDYRAEAIPPVPLFTPIASSSASSKKMHPKRGGSDV